VFSLSPFFARLILSIFYYNTTSKMNRDVATPAGVRVNSIVLAFTLVAGMIVFLRMFTRFYINKRAGFEDACIGFAMVSRSGCILVLFY
jgi:hypothetical protein